jgi:purine-binding chemotaxis protein CheW
MRGYLPENKKTEQVLKDRAKRLAKPLKIKRDGAEGLNILEFKIAQESYGIELAHIRMIHPLSRPTFLPGTPGFIRGIINVRGKIVSIVDLKTFFDLASQEPAGQPQVIILASKKMEFGILTDRIIGLKQIREDAIQPSLPTLTGIRAKYLKGVSRDGTVVLDGTKLLDDPEMYIDLEIQG